MGTYSLKTKLLVLIFISVGISFGILGYQNASNAYESKYTLVQNKEKSTAINIAEYFDVYFNSKIAVVNTFAKEFEKEELNIDNKNIFEVLDLGHKSGQFSLFFIGFMDTGHSMNSSRKILTVEKDNYDARKRTWFKEAVEKKALGISNPYWGKTLNTYVVTIYKPIFRNNEIVAVLGADIALDSLLKKLSSPDITDGGYAYVTDGAGEILIHKDKERIGKITKFLDKVKSKDEGYIIEKEDKLEQHIFFEKIKSLDWYIFIKITEESIFGQIHKEVQQTIILFVVLLTIILSILYLFLNRALGALEKFESGLYSFFSYLKGEKENIERLNITSNDEFGKMGKIIDEQMLLVEKTKKEEEELIQNVKEIVTLIKDGNLSKDVTKSSSNKSLNELKDILNDMILTIRRDVNSNINEIRDVLENYSKLDFTKHIEKPTGSIAIKVNQLCNIITKMLQVNKQNGEFLNENSQNLLENVKILNKSSNDTAVSLEESASALEEVTNTVKANTQDIQAMTEFSYELTSAISTGEELANKTVNAMDEINEETKLIEEAITVIDQIAFQTNILSLNAAVEAATAGEAGKGFAVVAQEVRNLASRSAEAAKEIKDLVEKASVKTNSGKIIADNMINGYRKLSVDVEKVTKIIASISTASKEQKISIEQVNDMINRIDQQTQQNASVASESQNIAMATSQMAQEILNSANEKKFNEQ